MAVPLLLSAIAILAGAVFAYGPDPMWARYAHGLDIILLARRLQWLAAAVSLIAGIGLIALVTVGRRRAWWLLALGPVLALFLHGITGGPTARMAVVDSPRLVSAAEADFLAENDWVVGVLFNGKAYAYPYSSLYHAPAIIQDDHDKHMLLMWSAFANRATAFSVRYDFKGRDLAIVSLPANSLLLHNSRRGQFINGFTGQMPDGQTPWGFGSALPVWKCTWRMWRQAQPKTLVMAVAIPPRQSAVPCEPLQPQFPVPHQLESGAARRVTLIATTQPAAIAADSLGDEPANIVVGKVPVLVVRDPLTGRPAAFIRELEPDQPAKFARNTSTRIKGDLIDNVGRSGWKLQAAASDPPLRLEAIDGPRKGQTLLAIPVDGNLPWGVVRTWYPAVQLVEPSAPPNIAPPPPAPRTGRRGR